MEKTTTNLPLFICFLCGLDAIGMSTIIMQLMPRILKLGASPFQNGLIGAIYGAMQLFSSPIMGNLGDKMNRKHLLIIIMLICSANYYVLGTASLPVLIITRIVSGLVKHTQLLLTACLSDTAGEKKSDYFGYLGAGMGLGFIFGPLIGGFLAELPDGFGWICTIPSLLFLINAALVWIFLPNFESKEIKKEKDDKPKSRSTGIQGFLENVGIEDCWDVLLLQGLVDFSMMIYFNNFVLELQQGYGLAPKNMGIFMSVISILGTLASLISGKIEKYTGEKAVPYMVGVIAFTYFIMLLPISFSVYALVVALMMSTSFMLKSWWPTMSMSRSPEEKSGAVIGASHSLMAISGMLAPIVAGASTELFGSISAPNCVALSICLSALVLFRWFPKPNRKQKVN